MFYELGVQFSKLMVVICGKLLKKTELTFYVNT